MERKTISEKIEELETELTTLKAQRLKWQHVREVEHGGGSRTTFNMKETNERIKEIETSLEVYYNSTSVGVV